MAQVDPDIWTRLRSLSSAPLLRRGAWGLPDQALTSATNFVTIVLIARAVSPDRFGEFALAVSFIQVTMALGTAALTQPFVVLAARHDKGSYRRFLGSTLTSHVAFVAVASLPVAFVAAIAFVTGWHVASLILMTIPAMAAWQIQDFVRQVFYAENRLGTAFLNDAISYGGQSGGFLAAFILGILTPVLGLAILAITSVVAIVVGLWHLRRSIDWSFSRQEFVELMSESWGFGRWILGSVLITSATSFGVSFLLAGLRGPAAVGVLRAFIATSAPVRILVEGAKTSFVPSAAQVLEREGAVALRSYVKRIFFLIAPFVIAYCLIAAIFSRQLLDFLYGDRFDNHASLLTLFMAWVFLMYIFFSLEIGLRARRIADVFFRVSALTALGNLALAPPLIYFFGLPGLVILLVALSPLQGVMMWFRYQQARRQDLSTTRSVETAQVQA